jgi:RimJ/RimL family protein N-acetyltransferase
MQRAKRSSSRSSNHFVSLLLPERIETGRLVLRRPVDADAEAIFGAYAQDPLVCRFMVWKPHASVDETHAFISSCISAWEEASRLAYVLTEAGSSSGIGMVEARPQGFTVDLGYVLAPAHWGKGYMPEAVSALAAAALEAGYFRVQAFCDVDNHPSQRTLEKAGFAREGRLERYMVHPNVSPQPRPCFMYSRSR